MFFSRLYYWLRSALFGPPDIGVLARRIADDASRRAFRLYRDKKFRQSVAFDTLTTTEQDRMFNELVASNIVLVMLMLDTFVKVADSERKENVRTMLAAVPEQFIQSLESLGIDRAYTEIWLKLLHLRRDEYEQTRLEHREHFPEFGEGNPWIHVVAVGCLFHIRRGQAIKKDPLLEPLYEQAIDIAERTRKAIESVIFSGSFH
ncbi:hypothetical protein HY624_03200 [Candidatus Uhrbacteria bacterium]|nr:hypothetical protein [Candidatus Uhrbacteria bacterium]